MSSRSAFHLARGALSRRAAFAAGTGMLGCSAWLAARHAAPRYRLDSLAVPRPSTMAAPREKEVSRGGLDPEMIRQLSGGSVTGFVAGLLISVFSRTLVLLLGLSVVAVQVAARYGVDVMQQLKVKERIGNSKILAALERDAAFKLSFGFFFAMSAFMRFQDL